MEIDQGDYKQAKALTGAREKVAARQKELFVRRVRRIASIEIF